MIVTEIQCRMPQNIIAENINWVQNKILPHSVLPVLTKKGFGQPLKICQYIVGCTMFRQISYINFQRPIICS